MNTLTIAPAGIASTGTTAETDRTGLSRDALRRAFLDNLFYIQGKFPALATKHDYYMALAYAVRDRMLQRWISTAAAYTQAGLAHGRLSLGRVPAWARTSATTSSTSASTTTCAQAVAELGLDLDELLAQEEEPGLGNGGLGPAGGLLHRFAGHAARSRRSATASATSSASSSRRSSTAGRWRRTDKWLRFGNPWEIARPEWARAR